MLSIVAALIASAISLVLSHSINCGLEELEKYKNLSKKLRLLKSKTLSLQQKLGELFSKKHLMKSEERRWKNGLRRLIEWSYNASEILDKVNLSKTRAVQHKKRHVVIKKTFQHASRIRTSSWNHKLARKVKKLLDDFEELERDIDLLIKIENTNPNPSHAPVPVPPPSSTSSTTSSITSTSSSQELFAVTDTFLLSPRRQEDKKKIIKKLTKDGVDDANNHFGGVSIVGMAGLGKSVLARSIVDDEDVQSKFCEIWWSSTPNLLEDSRPTRIWPKSTETKVITSVKTLRVLDGLDIVFSQSSEVQTFKSSHNIQKGDTLLITTRDPKVAGDFETALYSLQRMSNEECQELIKSILCCGGVPSKFEDRDFVARARCMADTCMGSPLVGSILGHDWFDKHKRGIIEAIKGFEQSEFWDRLVAQIFLKLRLDDLRLARHWNKWLYFTLFPCHHVFTKIDLLQLWMAEGFIHLDDWMSQQKALQHFDDMLPISLVEPGSSYGFLDNQEDNFFSYRTNEIMHRLLNAMTGNLRLVHSVVDNDTWFSGITSDNDDHSAIKSLRHLSICCQIIDITQLKEVAKHSKHLRTFLLLHKYGAELSIIPRLLFKKSSQLRAVDLSHSCIEILPDSIGNLKHLRYLNLSHTKIQFLPDPICELLSLVILKLVACSNLKQLPQKIGKLVNLTRLELDQTSLCPTGVGKLKKLQTLKKFCVEKKKGYEIIELKGLKELQGSIKIRQLENINDGVEAKEAELDKKPHLRELWLEWTNTTKQTPRVSEEILSQLKPHTNLEQVWVTNYSGHKFPDWINNSRYFFTTIHLYNCPGIAKLPPFWKLKWLKELRVEAIPQLESVGCEFFGEQKDGDRFKSLERLEFHKMERLVSFKGLRTGDMPRLKVLKFCGCPQLTELPTVEPLASLTNLEITFCPMLEGIPSHRQICSVYKASMT